MPSVATIPALGSPPLPLSPHPVLPQRCSKTADVLSDLSVSAMSASGSININRASAASTTATPASCSAWQHVCNQTSAQNGSNSF
ncbi:hypothetical protein ABBQ32_005613 [Trebouxia sp. C0010 RCD-2024]